MPLSKEVGLGQGHIVLDGDLVGTQPPHSSPSPLFVPCLLWPNGRPSQQLLSSCTNGREKTDTAKMHEQITDTNECQTMCTLQFFSLIVISC